MHKKLYTQIQEEFSLIATTFDDLEGAILSNKKLVTIQSKYNLHEIEPYYAELTNTVLPPDAKLIIEAHSDYDPEVDDLYDYKIDLETKRLYLKKQHYDQGVFYGTIFEYTAEYHKSFTVYRNQGETKTTNLSYLYLKDGLPHQFIQCTEYGISLKTYTLEGERIKGYKLEWPDYDHHCIGELSFDMEGKLIQIAETSSDGRMRVMYDASVDQKDLETVLSELEDFLVENIADQILGKVAIDEPVYCILFEYTMQGPFPPTIAFGVASEIEGRFEDREPYELYNAPDMKHFSESEQSGAIDIDFYQLDIQSNYLKTTAHGENIPWQDETATEAWATQVMNTYMRVCKRLMHFDFSSCFTKTEHFLVMARDFEQCNEDEFYNVLSAYKKEKKL